MTGRRLYDLFCAAHQAERYGARYKDEDGHTRATAMVAWPYLAGSEQRMWNYMARRLKGVKRG